jgi:hypothetical protein
MNNTAPRRGRDRRRQQRIPYGLRAIIVLQRVVQPNNRERAYALAETGGRQQHESRCQRPHARLRSETKADQERDSRQCRPIVVKSWLGMHGANWRGPTSPQAPTAWQRNALTVLLDQIDRLTDAAVRMLADAKDLN